MNHNPTVHRIPTRMRHACGHSRDFHDKMLVRRRRDDLSLGADMHMRPRIFEGGGVNAGLAQVAHECRAAFEGQEYGHGPCRLAAGRAAPHFIAALESAPVNTVCDRRFHLQRPALPHSKARWVKAATPGRGGWPPRICPSNIVEHALCLDDMAKNSAKIALLGR